MGPFTLGMLGTDAESVGVTFVQSEGKGPTSKGSLVCFNAGEDLAQMLARAEPAGGRIQVPKTDISQGFGYIAYFLGSEGKIVGLHSMR